MATSYELSGAVVIQPGTISQALINFTTCTFITRVDRCSVNVTSGICPSG